jgi:CubicO group peptidase (beta-lactamase class C family)
MKFPLLFLTFLFSLCYGSGQSPLVQIDSLMNKYYRPTDPGAVIAITLNQVTLFKKSYGVADLSGINPLTADANFNIGSLTKQFTAFALLDLYYKGKCSLGDSIGKYFTLPAALASVSISQLLSHSSGIPDHYAFTDTFKVKHATDKDVLTAVQKSDSLYFPAGTRYRYSNTAYCLLGLLIEKLSGRSYPEYLQQIIFGPLGMRDCSVFGYKKPIVARVTGYDQQADGKFVRSDADESIFFSTEADGGIYLSMNNYLKWCNAIESGEFSATRMIRKAWQGQTEIDTAQSLWYGCGWFIRQASGAPKAIYHTGFNGGFRTVVFMIPAQDYCISIFSNRSGIDLEELVSKINNILSISDNSLIKSGPLESFIHSWPIFAPCKKIRLYSTLSKKNLNAKDMVLN